MASRPSYANPAPGATPERIDEGKDWGNVTRIVAIGPGTISNIYRGLSGFGDTIIEKLAVSPGKYGPYIYYALETSGCQIVVSTGQQVQTGQTLADNGSGGGIEVGFWNPSTGRAVSAGQPFPTAAGAAFAALVGGGVSVPAGVGTGLSAIAVDTGDAVKKLLSDYEDRRDGPRSQGTVKKFVDYFMNATRRHPQV